MASVKKREGKRGTTYKVTWRLPDGSQRAKSFKSRDEAKAFKLDVEVLEREGRTPDPQKGAISLGAWSEEFLATLHLKPKTQANYESLLRSRILPEFGDTALSDISRLDVQKWVAAMADEVSASRVKAAYALLSQMLTEAVRHERLLNNVADGVKLPTVEKKQVRPLTLEELQRVAAEARAYEPLVLFVGIMGVRWAEAVGLRWENVSDGYVTIDRTLSEVTGKFHEVPTKNGEIRTLPMPQALIEKLPPRKGEYVFTTSQGNPVRANGFREKIWTPALERAGVDYIKIHHLRHTAASLLIQQGANIKMVQKWLGHKTIQITLDTYSHLFPSDLDNIAIKLDGLFQSQAD